MLELESKLTVAVHILIFVIFFLSFQFQSLGRQYGEVAGAKPGSWMLSSAYLTPLGKLFRKKILQSILVFNIIMPDEILFPVGFEHLK